MFRQAEYCIVRQWCLRLGLAVVALLGWATSPEGADDKPHNLRTIDFQEISFDLPGSDWERVREEVGSRIQFHRNEGEGPPYPRFQDITVWRVGVPPSLRGLSRPEHVSKYFDGERHLYRDQGLWEGFMEAEREIGGNRYPTMSFRITLPAMGSVMPVIEGLFLLHFPQDFEERQRFYVLMWQDFHPADEEGKGFDELDGIVSSFRVWPRRR